MRVKYQSWICDLISFKTSQYNEKLTHPIGLKMIEWIVSCYISLGVGTS